MGETGTPPDLPALPAITRYVAPGSGDDAFDGLTPVTPWRNPPGSAAATGVAAAYAVQPGDHIAFKGGERWHGRIAAPPAGTAEAYILWSGNAWGTGRCIMDGASAAGLTVRTADSQVDAGGNPNWENAAVRIVEWSDDGQPTWLYDGEGGLARAQYPRPADQYAFDTAGAAGKHFDLTDGQLASVIAGGFSIEDAALANHVRDAVGEAILWVRVTPSAYNQRRVIDVTGNIVTVESVAWSGTPYGAAQQAIFVQDCPQDVVQPGDWCLLSAIKALVWTRTGIIRRGIYEASAAKIIVPNSYNELRGFEITGHADAPGSATGLFKRSSGLTTGWRFRDNWVHDNRLSPDAGSQIMSLSNVGSAEITHNRFERHYPRAGVMVSGAPGLELAWNIFDRINATAIRLFSQTGYLVTGFRVHHNIIGRAYGVHSNGIASYQDVNDLDLYENAVFDCPRPLTIQGSCLTTGRKFRLNLFAASADGNGWGMWVNDSDAPVNLVGMEFSDNLNLGWAAGMLLKLDTPGLRLLRNRSTQGSAGSATDGSARSALTVDNSGTWEETANGVVGADYLTSSGAVLEPDRVDVLRPDGSRLLIDLRGVGV